MIEFGQYGKCEIWRFGSFPSSIFIQAVKDDCSLFTQAAWMFMIHSLDTYLWTYIRHVVRKIVVTLNWWWAITVWNVYRLFFYSLPYLYTCCLALVPFFNELTLATFFLQPDLLNCAVCSSPLYRKYYPIYEGDNENEFAGRVLPYQDTLNFLLQIRYYCSPCFPHRRKRCIKSSSTSIDTYMSASPTSQMLKLASALLQFTTKSYLAQRVEDVIPIEFVSYKLWKQVTWQWILLKPKLVAKLGTEIISRSW